MAFIQIENTYLPTKKRDTRSKARETTTQRVDTSDNSSYNTFEETGLYELFVDDGVLYRAGTVN